MKLFNIPTIEVRDFDPPDFRQDMLPRHALSRPDCVGPQMDLGVALDVVVIQVIDGGRGALLPVCAPWDRRPA